MIGKDEIAGIIEDYDRLKLRVGMTASHSALDICDGAIEEGFPTVAYCQKGRDKTYSQYFKTQRTVSGRVRSLGRNQEKSRKVQKRKTLPIRSG